MFLEETAFPNPPISIAGLTGYRIPFIYRDASTKEPVLTFDLFNINGGILIRTLGISETNSPLTFVGHCAPKEWPTWSKFEERNLIKVIERKKDVK